MRTCFAERKVFRMADIPSLNRHVAAEIRAELARRDITQTDFAQQLGWSGPYFSRRMNGEVPFNTDEIELMAKALELDLGDLLNGARR